MLINTDLFYTYAKEYQDYRKKIMDSYEQRLDTLKDMHGSKYYDDEMKKAVETRDNSINALKAQYSKSFNSMLKRMYDSNHSRKLKPPTDDELRVIQLLKMQDKPTLQELMTAENTLKDNAACMAVLREIAKKAGCPTIGHNADKTELSIDEVDNILKDLGAQLNEFMNYDTNNAARRALTHYSDKYGGTAPDAPPLPKRELFEDKAGCFRTLARMDGDSLKAFCNAVDTIAD